MTKSGYVFAAILILGVGLAGCHSGQADASGGQTCTYNGKVYPDRTSWLATDGCNECSCLGGHAGCSATSCDASAQAGTWCSYDGKSYVFGDTFSSTDGCNICECAWRWYHDVTPGPWEVACTMIGCTGGSDGSTLPRGDASADACIYNGTSYPTDAYFSTADGCDECHCRADGLVTCTSGHIGCQ